MDQHDILTDFEQFLSNHGDDAYLKISEFLDKERRRFEEEGEYDSETQARQGWVTVVGGALEKIILKIVQEFCEEHNLKITSDKKLKEPKTDELDRVRRNIVVNFGEYSLLPDGDIVIYCPATFEVMAIVSVKNSFRERYTETPYWKLKLKESNVTRDIRVFMATPDRDGEISFKSGRNGPRKARIVMEYELDGIYLARDEFESGEKVKSIAELVGDLEKLAEERPCQ